MASRQAAHACRRAGASAVPASTQLHAACARSRCPVRRRAGWHAVARGLRTFPVSSVPHPHRPPARPTRQRERACHIAVDGWLR